MYTSVQNAHFSCNFRIGVLFFFLHLQNGNRIFIILNYKIAYNVYVIEEDAGQMIYLRLTGRNCWEQTSYYFSRRPVFAFVLLIFFDGLACRYGRNYRQRHKFKLMQYGLSNENFFSHFYRKK